MKTIMMSSAVIVLFSILAFTGCIIEDKSEPEDQGATVYYSEWFYPTNWLGSTNDWYFEASAPDLTKDVVENGVILAYAMLDGDIYESSSVRPLPAYAVGANWSFLVHDYGYIEFICDSDEKPATTGNLFRFVAIPGTVQALKSYSSTNPSEEELRNMSYQEVCKLYNIPE